MIRLSFWCVSVVCFAAAVVLNQTSVSASDPSAAQGRIVVRIEDHNQQLTPVRAWVDAQGTRLFQPTGSTTATLYARDRSFSCDGTFTIDVPAGLAVIHVEKGKEYRPVELEIEVAAGVTVQRTIRLERWIDMPKSGWYSADLHVHLGSDDVRVLSQLAVADDVHLIPSFTYWLRGTETGWATDWPAADYGTPLQVDDRHLLTRNNLEIERIRRDAPAGGTVGATFLFNLNQPVSAADFGEHFPTDSVLCRVARRQSPDSLADSDKPSWAETVVQAALGQLDTVQVCHNHYHRDSTIPGGYGMIGPLAAGESNAAVGDGLFHRTNALYYRLLNCGFRLGVSGGSAIGVMPVPTGYNRVYAQIDGPLTADKLLAAIKIGRSFATSGPMLDLTVNDQMIGSTIAVSSNAAVAERLQIRTTVRSIDRLEALEIVHDGEVISSRDLRSQMPDPDLTATLEQTVAVTDSGWVAARALYRASDGLLRQAHTSPVYVIVDEKPIASAEDADYMLQWIEQLVRIAKADPNRFSNQDALQAVLTTYSEAAAVYEQIQATAQP